MQQLIIINSSFMAIVTNYNKFKVIKEFIVITQESQQSKDFVNFIK